MKKLALLSLLLVSLSSFAQIPVTDAAAGGALSFVNAQLTTGNMTLAELLAIQTASKAEAVQTTSNTLNTLKEAEKMYEIVEKVNSAVKSAKVVYEIYEVSKDMIQLTFDVQRVVNSSKLDGDLKKTIINTGTDLLNRAEAMIEIVNSVIGSGIMKGDDMQRMEILLGIKEKLDKQYTDLQAYGFNSIEMNGLNRKSLGLD